MINEETLIKTINEASSFRDVGKRLGISHTSVRYAAKHYKLKNPEHFLHGKKYESAINQTFNYLTVKNIFKEGRKHYCVCDCKCGKLNIKKRVDTVINGRVPSCGCLSKNRPFTTGENNKAFRGAGDIRACHIGKIIRAAKRRGIEYKIDKNYLWNLYIQQNKKCNLSGIPIVFGRVHFSHETTASLDRIDNNKGYEEGNVQWVHKDINKLKHDFVQSYFIKMCKQVASWNKIEPIIEQELSDKGIEVTIYNFDG